jgi:nicotinamide-nucleotide amidase
MHGSVSNETTAAMAEGAVARAPVDLAISINGVAGPGGGSVAKPVGLLIFGLAQREGPTRTESHVFDGDRAEVRQGALRAALGLLAAAARN